MLCVTCDNAADNTVMVENLAEALPSFPGRANHMRCFLHTINLVANLLTKLQLPQSMSNGSSAAAVLCSRMFGHTFLRN
jgi:hypothetical protein